MQLFRRVKTQAARHHFKVLALSHVAFFMDAIDAFKPSIASKLQLELIV